MAPLDSQNNTEVGSMADSEDNNRITNSPIQLNNREIYTRVSSNLELICLYVQINEQILAEPGANRHSRLFRALTGHLQ